MTPRAARRRAIPARGLAIFAASVLLACGGGGGSTSVDPPSGNVAERSLSLRLLAGSTGGGGNLDGIGTAARLAVPLAVAVDGQGNAYIAEPTLQVVRRITPDGTVSDVVGKRGEAGWTDGIGTAALLDTPAALAFDGLGRLFVGQDDAAGGPLRRVDADGRVRQLPQVGGPVAADRSGRVHVIDGMQVNRIEPDGTSTWIAGLRYGWDVVDGPAATAKFYNPIAIAVGTGGEVYVVDRDPTTPAACPEAYCRDLGTTIRRVSPEGVVTTVAGRRGERGHVDAGGGNARFVGIRAISAMPDGSLLIADTGGHTLRRLTPDGTVATLAGRANESGHADGALATVRLAAPAGLAVSRDGTVWITEAGNFTLRRIDPTGRMSTVAGQWPEPGSSDGASGTARLRSPQGLAVDSDGTVFVADTGNHTLRRIAVDGTTTTLAGLAGAPGWVDGPPGTSRLNAPTGVAIDRDGSLLVADHDNQAIRRVSRNGSVSTVADLRPLDYVEPAAGRRLPALPRSITVTANDTLIVADDGARRILSRSASGIWSVLAGHPQAVREGAHDGSGEGATFGGALGVAASADGLLYVADVLTVRKITPDRWVSTFVGADAGYSDGLGIQATFRSVMGVAVDASGNVLMADRDNHVVRSTTPTATTRTVVGQRGSAGIRLGSDSPSLGAVTAVATGPQGLVILCGDAVLVATR